MINNKCALKGETGIDVKKFLWIFLSFVVFGVIVIALFRNTVDNTESLEVDDLAIIDSTLYIISEGDAYYLSSEKEWIRYETEGNLKQFQGRPNTESCFEL